MLKGKYPKDFKFTGWHPHCRCIATTILKTKEEMEADDEAILRGEQPADPDTSENAVTHHPDNFTKWLADNEERAKTHYSVPYFLRDNQKYVPKELPVIFRIFCSSLRFVCEMINPPPAGFWRARKVKFLQI